MRVRTRVRVRGQSEGEGWGQGSHLLRMAVLRVGHHRRRLGVAVPALRRGRRVGVAWLGLGLGLGLG